LLPYDLEKSVFILAPLNHNYMHISFG